jgi:G3E family GTPase
VTGFLGAGKTTFINRLLGDPALVNVLVIVNEFGEIGLDHRLYEKIADDVVLLASGCLCCNLRGDLVDALRDVLARRDAGALPPFSRIVLETSGLADPAPILHALLADPLLMSRVRLAGVTTVVDAVNGIATLEAHPEARRQVALADLIVVSKRDLVAGSAALKARLAAINPAARFVETGAPEAVKAFLAETVISPMEARKSARSAHGADARAFAFARAEPIVPTALLLFFARLDRLRGPRLLRVKGLIATRQSPEQPLLIQGAQHLMHPPRRLAAWPQGIRETRLVVIVDGIADAEVDALWSALIGAPEIDRPDLAALVDNPLAPRPGGLFG